MIPLIFLDNFFERNYRIKKNLPRMVGLSKSDIAFKTTSIGRLTDWRIFLFLLVLQDFCYLVQFNFLHTYPWEILLFYIFLFVYNFVCLFIVQFYSEEENCGKTPLEYWLEERYRELYTILFPIKIEYAPHKCSRYYLNWIENYTKFFIYPVLSGKTGYNRLDNKRFRLG